MVGMSKCDCAKAGPRDPRPAGCRCGDMPSPRCPVHLGKWPAATVRAQHDETGRMWEGPGDQIPPRYSQIPRQQISSELAEARAGEASAERIAQLESALRDAIEDIESWAGYASDYFRDKHDLAGCLAKHRATLLNNPE